MENQSYLKQFKTYQLAIAFHRMAMTQNTPRYLRDQLLRASSSIALTWPKAAPSQPFATNVVSMRFDGIRA